jgi:acyl dehydratase
VFHNLAEVSAAVGKHLGYSDWLEISQDRINMFAQATGDGSYLTLSLSNYFLPQILEVQGISMGVNYGVNRVRFPAPVTVGSRLRAGAQLIAADPIAGGLQTTMLITLEAEGGDKPVCTIEAVSCYLA